MVDDAQLGTADHGAVADDERLLLVGRSPADVEVHGVAADGVGVRPRHQLAVLDVRAGQLALDIGAAQFAEEHRVDDHVLRVHEHDVAAPAHCPRCFPIR